MISKREYDKVFYSENSWEFDESFACSILLREKVLFCGNFSNLETVGLYVICSDVFTLGCSDRETISMVEIGDLFKLVSLEPKFGSAKWCCLKRNLQPQSKLKESMEFAGVWNSIMEKLKVNRIF